MRGRCHGSRAVEVLNIDSPGGVPRGYDRVSVDACLQDVSHQAKARCDVGLAVLGTVELCAALAWLDRSAVGLDNWHSALNSGVVLRQLT